MSQSRMVVLAAVAFLLVLLGLQSVFVIDQTQQAMVLQLGRPVSDKPLGPGLHFKLPILQNVVRFDSRLLESEARSREILTRDKKTMVVDNYTKWRIVDPLRFYRTVGTIPRALARLEDIIYSEVRTSLGNYTLIEIIADKRAEIMREVAASSNTLVDEFGIEVVDVRIKRTDLPAENERAIFGRMRAERERQARQYRSEGQEEAAKIRAGADRERTVLLAEAESTAQGLRGEGEASAISIWADGLRSDPEYFEFARSLEAYQKAFGANSRVLLTPESPFLKYLQ